MESSLINREILTKRTAFLKNVDLFAGLKIENLKIIAKNLSSRRYKKMDIIFHHGDDSHALYIIAKGKVRIFRINPTGDETSFRIFSEKDVIGEFAAIDGRARSTTAKALEDCILMELEHTKFLEFLHEMPKLSLSLIKHLVKKLRWTTDYAETIARYDTTGRLLHIILQYNDLFGKEIEAGMVYELDLYMNQEDLASLVGARREWVNRILQKWRKKGLIESEHGRIKILNLPAVEKERNMRMDIHAEEGVW
jgi:CRP-like cAMP-binding protein